MALEYMNDMAALAMVMVMAAGIRGMLPIAWTHDQSATMYMARGLVLIFTGSVFRALYWDIVPTLWHFFLPGELPSIYGLGTGVNTLFIVINLWGVWHIMRALQEILPPVERPAWPLWRIAFYPRGTCWSRLVRMFSREK